MTPYYSDPLVTIYHGDCLEVLPTLEADSVDAVVTDPPYGLEFMGKGWDKFGRDTGPGYREKPRMTDDHMGKGFRQLPNHFQAGAPFQRWCEQWGREALRVTKPGGYLLAFGGTRTHHRLVCALEDAGWIIRDELDWIYASGFPKGKANLKPAHEPIVLARKPGPLRPLGIDECRIGAGPRPEEGERGRRPGGFGNVGADKGDPRPAGPMYAEGDGGRWPSNVLLSDPELFDEPNPYVVGSGATAGDFTQGRYHLPDRSAPDAMFAGGRLDAGNTYTDTGGYSRFFTIPQRYNETCVRCGLAISAGPTSSPPRPSADSVPSDAATSPDGTPDSTVPEDSSATPARSTKRRRNATEPVASPTTASPLPTPASPAEQLAESTDTTTTTPGPWMCGSCAAAVTSESTQPPEKLSSLELTPAARHEYPTHLIVPKADRAERERGLVGASEHVDIAGLNTPDQRRARGRNPDGIRARANVHPTVKPIDLMRHLVRLVTPPGGTVLDPFLGSGTTALASSEEGFRCIGIEREAEYLEIAKGRLMATPMGLGLDHGLTGKAPPKTHPDLSKHQPKRRAPSENYTGGWTGTADEEPAA